MVAGNSRDKGQGPRDKDSNERICIMAKQATTANLPAVAESMHFAIMEIAKGEISSILSENLGSEELTANDLPRVTVPAGGGTMFSVPGIDGPQDTKEIVGIIVATKHVRAYWPDSFDETGGGTPPQCFSEDGEHGIGDPGIECATCPNAAFGTAKKGKGKACSEKRLIFLTTPDEILPITIIAPPTSLKNVKSYLMGLTSRGKKLHEILTGITLEKDKSADNIVFSKLVLRKVGEVENKELMQAYANSIKPYLVRAVREIAAVREPLDDFPS